MLQQPTDNAKICTFCRTNDGRPKTYTGHMVKDASGRVTCPILRRYVCPLCGATGDKAHTVRYCPRSAGLAVPDVRKLKATDRHARKSLFSTFKVSMTMLLCVQKVKGHTLYIAPVSEGTSLQKHSGMARAVDGFHSFICPSTRLSTNRMNHTCVCLPSRSWSSFTDPRRMEG